MTIMHASSILFFGTLVLTARSLQAFRATVGRDGYSTYSSRLQRTGKSSSTSLCMSVPTPLDTLTSGLASMCRLPRGVTVDVDALDLDRQASRGDYFAIEPKQSLEPPARLVELYDVENHRECRKVRERITELDLVVERVIPAAKNSRVFTDPDYEFTLMPGKLASYEDIPILVVLETDGTRKTFSGAKNICAYLEATFTSPFLPKKTEQEKILSQTIDAVQEFGNFAANLLRMGRGTEVCSAARAPIDRSRRVPRPVSPLILYSYEGNQFCRLVREVLTELDIVYELRSSGKGSPRRLNELVKISGGSTQCPFLVDPNTITVMPESADIIRYLYSRYALWTPPNELLRWTSDNILPIARPLFQMLTPIQAGRSRNAENGDSLFEEIMRIARQEIEATVGATPVVIFTYEWSPFSHEAKTLLDGLSVNYQEICLGREWLPGLIEEDGARIRAALLDMTGQSSLPHIFVNGKSIGGLFSGTPGLVPALEQGIFMKMVQYGALSLIDDEMSLR